MKKLTCFLLCACLLLSACSPPPNEPDAFSREQKGISAPHSQAQESSKSPQPMIPTGPSCVEQLAIDIVKERKITAGQGEVAIRSLYHYLIETVWFSDPVGLDTWRYMTAYDQTPISYLDNRALSPLLFGIGSCEDFASAMVLLLRAAGFESEYVAGFTLSVDQIYIDHAWAVVKLNGSWYHIDPQLEQNVTRNNKVTYRYYLKSDRDFDIDHKWGENLIEYWPGMPEREKAAIREAFIPPTCPEPYSQLPAPIYTALPKRPDLGAVEQQITGIKRESGKAGLPAIWLDVEPPILVAEHHVTPPLLDQNHTVKATGFRYGRSFLEGEAAALYDQLSAFVETREEGNTFPLSNKMRDSDVLFVTDTFLAEHPVYYWAELSLVRRNDLRFLLLSLRIPPAEITRQKEEIDVRVREILAPVEGSPPFSHALAIHDALAAVPYDREETGMNSDNLYGILVEGAATCYGYAGGFQYLAEQAGIDCVLLTGHTPRGIGHAWNAIRLDGAWHYVDVTWDRPLQGEDTVYHDFFLMTEEEMKLERGWDDEQYPALPESSEEFSSYYRRMEYAVSGPLPGDAADVVADIFYHQLMAKPTLSPEEPRLTFLELKVEGTPREYNAWKEFFVKALFEIQRKIQAKADLSGGFVQLSDLLTAKCDFNDTMQVLTLYPTVTQMEEATR